MSTSLRILLTKRELEILIDKYVLKVPDTELFEKHQTFKEDFDRIKLITIYDNRQAQHYLYRRKIVFDEVELIRQVWKEFVSREISAGKTSLDISEETNTSLEEVNSYF